MYLNIYIFDKDLVLHKLTVLSLTTAVNLDKIEFFPHYIHILFRDQTSSYRSKIYGDCLLN